MWRYAKAGFVASFFILLSACATPPQTKSLRDNPPEILPQVQLEDVPFYPQEDFYCGPTTLAEVLNYYGQSVSPDDIAPLLFVPDRKGTFQTEMVATARSFDFIAYQERGDLTLLLKLIEAKFPVIVFQNLSVNWYPVWHYAVVKGYDLDQETLYLHSGKRQNYEMSFDVFERTWRRGNFWLLVPMPPHKTNPHLNSFVYTRSAQDLLSVGRDQAAITALKSAVMQWPDYWLSYFLLGNFYVSNDIHEALRWYKKGKAHALNNPAYLNNYAFALAKAGFIEEGFIFAERALSLDPGNTSIQDTYNRIREKL